ncbi:MAG: class 1 isoprenoid biosynthesis enzyme, partial [Gemmatimonadetes bacterium]|nr:class 1 isoprenoid biosynthesis enzyme [Gemmatimonadota bacterium]
EEGGVREIPRPEEMVEHVHRVRGGRLFELAFVAPKLLETGEAGRRVRRAEPALARLGTAFQIVDDLTDFEFDLDRRSHNLLVSQIRHHGTSRQRAKLVELWGGAPARPGLVESLFREPARAVLGWAYREARAAFRAFEELGFWFPARLADQVVHAIVGLEGVTRMEAIASP